MVLPRHTKQLKGAYNHMGFLNFLKGKGAGPLC